MKLHDYQKVAVAHLHRNPRSALFLDMGLGKTAIVLNALTPAHLPALVIAPKRVAENVWETEATQWRSDLSIRLAVGSVSQRTKAFHQKADITVIGVENLQDQLCQSTRFKTVILDEISKFKAQGTVRWKTGKKITPYAEHVWGLTGTPAPNGLMDLWAQMYLIDGGARLGKTMGAYRSRYFFPGRQLANGVITEWHLREGAEAKIHALLGDICLSMDSEGRIDLPPVTYNPIVVPMRPSDRKIYNSMRDTMVANLEILGGEVHTAGNAATVSGKLSQVTAGFMYVDDADTREGAYDIIHHEKVRAIQEIVEGTGSPVLVFYRFKAERDMIAAAMPGLVHFADEPRLQERWNNGEFPVLLVHPQSVGHGLNLQHGGHTIVWSSLTWSLEDWEQGNKRLARQGQEHPVMIHILLTPNTIDGAIRSRLQDKKTVQEALRNYLDSPL